MLLQGETPTISAATVSFHGTCSAQADVIGQHALSQGPNKNGHKLMNADVWQRYRAIRPFPGGNYIVIRREPG